MQHVFIINPCAGRGGAAELERALRAYDGQLTYTVHHTAYAGEATAFVRGWCDTHPEPVRFYACGGDGTLQEVVSGVIGYPQASVTAYACGSGNDFVRCYGGQEPFLDVDALLHAVETPIDVIRIDDAHCAVNAFHFGFDSAVAVIMNAIRHKKVIGGRHAYTTAVAQAFFTRMRTACTVTVDGEVLNPDGRLLLCTVANGQYVGGGYRCAPRSRNDDGLLEVCLVKPVSRPTFLRLMGAYRAGRHLEDERLAGYIVYRRGREVSVSSPDAGFACALDGEVLHRQQVTATVMERAVRFAVPRALLPKETAALTTEEVSS